jgi:N-acetylglucosamine kinase-like BadF-type ATPase
MAAIAVKPGLFIGVDSGGTRTNIRLELRPHEGEPTREEGFEVSDSLSGALPNDSIPVVLRKIFAKLEAECGSLEDEHGLPAYVWISAAGYTPWTRERYVAAVHEVAAPILKRSIRCIGVANDAVSLLLGSDADAVIIAGTGSNVIVQGKDGKLHQFGGHEWVACDYGSGFWIGLRGIRQAYRAHEDRRETVLLQRFRDHYQVDSDDQHELVRVLRRLAVGDKDMKRDIARFAHEVCSAAVRERGDTPARKLVKEEAEDLADVTVGGLRRCFDPDERATGLRLLECGSLFGNDFYCSSFECRVEEHWGFGGKPQGDLAWERVTTGVKPAMRLARSLATDAERFLTLDPAFRPAVVHL